MNCCSRARDSGVPSNVKRKRQKQREPDKNSQHQNQLHISKITPDPDPNPPLHFNPPRQHHQRAPPPALHQLKTLSHSLFHQSSQKTLAPPPPHHSRALPACLPARPPHALSQAITKKFKILLLPLPPPLIPPIESSFRRGNCLASQPKAYLATDMKKVANAAWSVAGRVRGG